MDIIVENTILDKVNATIIFTYGIVNKIFINPIMPANMYSIISTNKNNNSFMVFPPFPDSPYVITPFTFYFRYLYLRWCCCFGLCHLCLYFHRLLLWSDSLCSAVLQVVPVNILLFLFFFLISYCTS